MAEEVNSYEEQRRRQVEENRRKLEELRLHHLSAAVREAAARPKPKPKPKRKVPAPGELRRSGRVASLPEKRDHRGVYEAYAVGNGPTDEERAGAIAMAEELKRRIDRIRWPAFVKPMTHNAVSRAVEMIIPKNFIKYLPAHDEAVVVVDEVGDEFHMMYRAKKGSRVYKQLDKGWRGFAVHHDLADGDCLVFQLTERAKFKVYIFRASPDYESDQTSDDDEQGRTHVGLSGGLGPHSISKTPALKPTVLLVGPPVSIRTGPHSHLGPH